MADHLYDYADGITIGAKVMPTMVVGYVGNTGNCGGVTTEEKEDGSGTHLHVSVYITKKAKDMALHGKLRDEGKRMKKRACEF